MILVHNVSSHAHEYKYMIVRKCDTELWYYGADNDHAKCQRIAQEIGNGLVFESEDIKPAEGRFFDCF